MLHFIMRKLFLLVAVATLFSGCINKHGISLKYYSDCKEYYDMQGYYHKECGKDDIITYKKVGNLLKFKSKREERNVY